MPAAKSYNKSRWTEHACVFAPLKETQHVAAGAGIHPMITMGTVPCNNVALPALVRPGFW